MSTLQTDMSSGTRQGLWEQSEGLAPGATGGGGCQHPQSYT